MAWWLDPDAHMRFANPYTERSRLEAPIAGGGTGYGPAQAEGLGLGGGPGPSAPVVPPVLGAPARSDASDAGAPSAGMLDRIGLGDRDTQRALAMGLLGFGQGALSRRWGEGVGPALSRGIGQAVEMSEYQRRRQRADTAREGLRRRAAALREQGSPYAEAFDLMSNLDPAQAAGFYSNLVGVDAANARASASQANQWARFDARQEAIDRRSQASQQAQAARFDEQQQAIDRRAVESREASLDRLWETDRLQRERADLSAERKADNPYFRLRDDVALIASAQAGGQPAREELAKRYPTWDWSTGVPREAIELVLTARSVLDPYRRQLGAEGLGAEPPEVPDWMRGFGEAGQGAP